MRSLPFTGIAIILLAFALAPIAAVAIGWIAAKHRLTSWLSFFLPVALLASIAITCIGGVAAWVDWWESDCQIARQVENWPGKIIHTEGGTIYEFHAESGYYSRILRRQFAPQYLFLIQLGSSFGIGFATLTLLISSIVRRSNGITKNRTSSFEHQINAPTQRSEKYENTKSRAD